MDDDEGEYRRRLKIKLSQLGGSRGSSGGYAAVVMFGDSEGRRPVEIMTKQTQTALAEADALHERAMEHYFRSETLQFQGRREERDASLEAAFLLERDAADRLASPDIPEPSRSVFHRSAAALAVRVRKYDEAQRLIQRALDGAPPEYARRELRQLLSQISSRQRSPKFELKANGRRQYLFNLKAANGEVILTSERYQSKDAALRGIKSVKSHSSDDSLFAVRTAKNGQAYFVLSASNNHVIGRSEMYKTAAGCQRGIASVKRNAKSAAVEDRTIASRSA